MVVSEKKKVTIKGGSRAADTAGKAFPKSPRSPAKATKAASAAPTPAKPSAKAKDSKERDGKGVKKSKKKEKVDTAAPETGSEGGKAPAEEAVPVPDANETAAEEEIVEETPSQPTTGPESFVYDINHSNATQRGLDIVETILAIYGDKSGEWETFEADATNMDEIEKYRGFEVSKKTIESTGIVQHRTSFRSKKDVESAAVKVLQKMKTYDEVFGPTPSEEAEVFSVLFPDKKGEVQLRYRRYDSVFRTEESLTLFVLRPLYIQVGNAKTINKKDNSFVCGEMTVECSGEKQPTKRFMLQGAVIQRLGTTKSSPCEITLLRSDMSPESFMASLGIDHFAEIIQSADALRSALGITWTPPEVPEKSIFNMFSSDAYPHADEAIEADKRVKKFITKSFAHEPPDSVLKLLAMEDEYPISRDAMDFITETAAAMRAKKIIDIGTGNGALALSLAFGREVSRVTTIDGKKGNERERARMWNAANPIGFLDFRHSEPLHEMGRMILEESATDSVDFITVRAQPRKLYRIHEKALQMLRLHGSVLYLDVFYNGKVFRESIVEEDEETKGAYDFLRHIQRDDRVQVSFCPCGSGGVTIVTKVERYRPFEIEAEPLHPSLTDRVKGFF